MRGIMAVFGLRVGPAREADGLSVAGLVVAKAVGLGLD
jgi:hypothetical protein